MISAICLIWPPGGKRTSPLMAGEEALREEGVEGPPTWPLPSEWLQLENHGQDPSSWRQRSFGKVKQSPPAYFC